MSALVEQTPRFSLLSKVTKYKQEVVMNQTQRDATCKCSVLQKKINKCCRGSFCDVHGWLQGEICSLLSQWINVICWRVCFPGGFVVAPLLFSESLTSSFSRTPVISVEVSSEFHMLGVTAVWFDFHSREVLWFPHLIVYSLFPSVSWEYRTVAQHFSASFECVMPCFGFLVTDLFFPFLHI